MGTTPKIESLFDIEVSHEPIKLDTMPSGVPGIDVPVSDNTPGSVRALQVANGLLREKAWPAPFDRTSHALHLGDARTMGWIADASVHLVVTSPPYWTLKQYTPENPDQMGDITDYEAFLDELDKVWRECHRVLCGGGRVCCVVGDVCIPAKRRLLTGYESLFRDKPYRHRDSSQGDYIAGLLYEDLLAIGRAKRLTAAVAGGLAGVNLQNRLQGVRARRGDGTFGEFLPGSEPLMAEGYSIGRGTIATVEIGVEVKILFKAMIKQIDRVISDLEKQAFHFRRAGGQPICIAIVGVNHAEYTVGYEGDRAYRTDGKSNRHPVQEATKATERLIAAVTGKFDELLILPFEATNESPYTFRWTNFADTEANYAAALVRVGREYDRRF